MLVDAANRVLIAQRPPGTHMAGGWEFPGGKLEPGEDRRAGLARELREELDIDIRDEPLRPLIRITHDYPSRTVLLDTWVVPRFRGTPRGLDGQALRWCPLNELGDADLLPADAPIVKALRLPVRLRAPRSRDYTLFDHRPRATGPLHPRFARRRGRQSARGSQCAAKPAGVVCATPWEAEQAWRGGADFLVLRDRLPPAILSRICRSVPLPVYACGMPLEKAWRLGATGLNELVRSRATSRREC